MFKHDPAREIAILVGAQQSLLAQVRGILTRTRCPYCGARDRNPSTHIAEGRCR